MLRRYRWLLFGAAAGAFAVGFLLTLAALAPVPGAPGQAAEPAAPAGDDAPCSDYSGTFVGVHDGRVAVFEGVPGGCRRLVETHPISVQELPAFQAAELERGIEFSGHDELFQILEGLTAP